MPITLDVVLEVWPGARLCAPGEIAAFEAGFYVAPPPLNLIPSANEIGVFQGMIEENQKKYSLECGYKKSKFWGGK